MLTQESIPSGVQGENPNPNHPYYYYPGMTPHPHLSIPKLPHHNIPLHPHPSMPPNQIFLCPYFIYTPMYAPYVFQHHPHITSLGYLHKPPSRLPSSMFPNLLPPEAIPHS